jgi:hypothetical protein
MIKLITKYFLFCFVISGCSQPEFSGNSAPSTQQKVAPKKDKDIDAKLATRSNVLLASDLTAYHNSEGASGSCEQQVLGAGRRVINESIVPTLKQKFTGNLVEIQLAGRADILIDMAALSCDKSASSWTSTSMQLVCQKQHPGIGALRSDQYFGTASVCGESYPNQTPFAPSDKNIGLIAGLDASEVNHLYLVTYKFGSSMPGDKFVALLRKKFGIGLKISVIYPKTQADCVARGINPPSSDTLWRALPASASGPSTVFEEIASATGGSTYDLCSSAVSEAL